jgi:hypothetical protein
VAPDKVPVLPEARLKVTESDELMAMLELTNTAGTDGVIVGAE